MEVQDFINFLTEHGIEHSTSGQSIKIKDCPECGASWKVHLRAQIENGLMLGRCYSGRCQTDYSSVKYLRLAGIPEIDIQRLHADDAQKTLEGIGNSLVLANQASSIDLLNSGLAQQNIDFVDISEFKYFLELDGHPAALYAAKRGAVPVFYDRIMIDPVSNAVVFVIFHNDVPVGWQKRYLEPKADMPKTKTSPGFKRDRYLLEFPGNGPIAVCEGPFTALSAWHYGYHGVCTFGSSVPVGQAKLIRQLAHNLQKEVCVAFDTDEAGKKGLDFLRKELGPLITKEILPEYGNDLNESWMNTKGIIAKPLDTMAMPELHLDINF